MSVSNDSVLLLSKLGPVFVYPLGLGLLFVLAGIALAARPQPRLGRLSLALAVMILWVSSMPLVADTVLGALEGQHPPRPLHELPSADVAIVLGGAIGGSVPPRVSADLSDAADRVLQAARLFKAGKVPRILVTGGNLPWGPAAVSEAELIRDLLVEWGVPHPRIEIGTASRTTAENAREIRAVFDAAPFASALLVTSAFHMPRALAVFRKAGLPVTPAAADVRAVRPSSLTVLDVLPDAEALAKTTLAVKEVAGMIIYRMRGDL